MTSPSPIGRSFATFALLLKPLRWVIRTRRRFVTAGLVLLALAAAPVVWWSCQLWNLPDVGDPFDVAAFRAETIPDDSNAFVLYHQAAEAYRKVAASLSSSDAFENIRLERSPKWATTNSETRRWAELNSQAVNLMRQAADLPDALDPMHGTRAEFFDQDAIENLQRFVLLAASRAEDEGNMAGAWDWYRTYFRTIVLQSRRTMVYRREAAVRWSYSLAFLVSAWLNDPRTTPTQIRRALDDVLACAALVPSDPYTVKAEYVYAKDNPQEWQKPIVPPLTMLRSQLVLWGIGLTDEQVAKLDRAEQFWHRQPERRRRLMQLLIANRLAYHELPVDRRPLADPIQHVPQFYQLDLYTFGSEAPASARALPTVELDRWVESTSDIRELINRLDWSNLSGREQGYRRNLIMLLANALYRRDHGTDPPEPEALVGPYLKALP